jgi:hypothetical protein
MENTMRTVSVNDKADAMLLEDNQMLLEQFDMILTEKNGLELYREFMKEKLKEWYGVDSMGKISADQRKEFFKKVGKAWQEQKSKNAKIAEPVQESYSQVYKKLTENANYREEELVQLEEAYELYNTEHERLHEKDYLYRAIFRDTLKESLEVNEINVRNINNISASDINLLPLDPQVTTMKVAIKRYNKELAKK